MTRHAALTVAGYVALAFANSVTATGLAFLAFATALPAEYVALALDVAPTAASFGGWGEE